MKNLFTNVKNDCEATVERQSSDSQRQRHYQVLTMRLARPALFSTRVWKYAAMIALLLTLVCGNAWG